MTPVKILYLIYRGSGDPPFWCFGVGPLGLNQSSCYFSSTCPICSSFFFSLLVWFKYFLLQLHYFSFAGSLPVTLYDDVFVIALGYTVWIFNLLQSTSHNILLYMECKNLKIIDFHFFSPGFVLLSYILLLYMLCISLHCYFSGSEWSIVF